VLRAARTGFEDFGPLYLIALTDRLNARPVRLVFEWLSDVFGGNPWFSDEFRLHNPSGTYDAGFRKMFNLEGIAGTDTSR